MQGYQKDAYPWDVDSQSLALQNRSSTWEHPYRQKWWAFTNSCQPSAGTNISLRHKAKMLRIIVCTRTTIVPLSWRIMGRPQAAKWQSTLTFIISLSLIGLIMVHFQYSGVLQGIWLATTLPNLFRVVCSGSSEKKLWEWSRMNIWAQERSRYNILGGSERLW